MSILKKLTEQWKGNNKDFLITDKQSFKFEDFENIELNFLDSIKSGDIVGLIGDFDPISIISLIKLPSPEPKSQNLIVFFFESRSLIKIAE